MKAKGFTLIELLLVVAVIGILSAIAIPFFLGYRMKVYNAIAVSDLKGAYSSLEAYRTDKGQYP